MRIARAAVFALLALLVVTAAPVAAQIQGVTHQTLTVGTGISVISAATLNPSRGQVSACTFTVESNTIRFWWDGGVPSTSTGHQAVAGSNFTITGYTNLSQWQATRESSNATVQVSCGYGANPDGQALAMGAAGSSATITGDVTVGNVGVTSFPDNEPFNIAQVGGNNVTTTLPVSGTVTANLGTIGTAATAANQSTGNSSLSSIDGKITAVNTGAVVVASSALPSLAATSTKQSDGSQKTQIVDGAGAVIGSTSNALDVNIKSGAGSGGTAAGDNSAFTAGTTSTTPASAFYHATVDTVTDGRIAALGMTSKRALFTSLYTPNGTSAMSDTAGAVKMFQVDPSTGTAVAQDTQAQQDVAIAGGTVGNATGSFLFGRGSATAPTDVGGANRGVLPWHLLNGSYVSNLAAGGTLITATSTSLNTNVTNSVTVAQGTGTNLHMVCDSGCSSSTAPADNSAFTAGTTSSSPMSAFYHATVDTVTDGRIAALGMTNKRALFTSVFDVGGTAITDSTAHAMKMFLVDPSSGTAITGDTQVQHNVAVTRGNVTGAAMLCTSQAGGAPTAVGGDDRSVLLNCDRSGTPYVNVLGALPAGTNGIGKLTSNTGVTIGAVELAASQTLGTVTSLTQFNGNTIATNNGTATAGTARVTEAGSTPILANALSTTVVTVVGSAAQLTSYYCSNPNTAGMYVQIFDISGSVTLGTSTPKWSIKIPPNDSAANMAGINLVFGNAIKVAATTTATGSSAPSTALDCNFGYR